MLGDLQVIAHLNAQLKNVLTATNQYFLHYRLMKHWGCETLATMEYQASIRVMWHADTLMERILMLDGMPNPRGIWKLAVGATVGEALQGDLMLEQMTQSTLRESIARCEAVRDYVSRQRLSKILDRANEHIDLLETQIGLIDQIGLNNYLQSQTDGQQISAG